MNEEIKSKLNEWACKYVPKFNDFGVCYYTQSPLDKAEDVDLMVIGINPKGNADKAEPLTPDDYLKGNTTWTKRFDKDGQISKNWSKYLYNARFFLGCSDNKKTNLPIDDDSRTVWTNLVPIPSQNGFTGLNKDMRMTGVQSTLELINILKPKRIVFFSTAAFSLLEKYASSSDSIEHVNVIENMSLEIGCVNGIPAVSINHPSQRWVVSNMFIPTFIFLHRLYCEKERRQSVKDLRKTMRNEIRLWLKRIALEEGNIVYKG